MCEALCHECFDRRKLDWIIRGLEKRIAKAHRKNKLNEAKRLRNILDLFVMIAVLAEPDKVLLGVI